MTDLPWFPFYVDDYLGSEAVCAMNMAARGVYTTMLAKAWRQGSVPADLDQLARVLQMPRRQLEAVWPKVAACWEETSPGRLTNPRQEAERAKASRDRQRHAEAGALGAEARWQKHGKAIAEPSHRHTSANGPPMAKHGEIQSHPHPDTTAPPSPSRARGAGALEGFEVFWQAYPRQEARGRAERAWVKLHPPLPAVLEAIAWQTHQGRLRPATAEGRSLVPLPASWLHDRGWEDARGNGPVAGPDPPGGFVEVVGEGKVPLEEYRRRLAAQKAATP